MQKITPFLWFDHEAGEAAGFYAHVFGEATIPETTRIAQLPKMTYIGDRR